MRLVQKIRIETSSVYGALAASVGTIMLRSALLLRWFV
ncbi:hypothetical protein CASFOL_014611 [Castilleja foliolosa]|uniref:Uncharacterized protein n=1 Tax=Castilleja foliolosa TaxID=1961234 RepID=A0ABD3DSG3_9LAMI